MSGCALPQRLCRKGFLRCSRNCISDTFGIFIGACVRLSHVIQGIQTRTSKYFPMPSSTVLVAVAMFCAGSAFYAFSLKERSSLDVPLISRRGKKVVGGTLMFFAGAVICYWYLKLS